MTLYKALVNMFAKFLKELKPKEEIKDEYMV